MVRISTDRSRILDYQSCPRRRFLAYHEGNEGLGITSQRKPLPLAVGGAVHEGLAELLRGKSEDDAVATALADFAAYAGHLELDLTETTAQIPTGEDTGAQLAASLGMSPEDAGLGDLNERVGKARSEFDQFLYAEQVALVEALVRAYSRRRLRPLLEQFEVLEVEREGSWLLSTVTPDNYVEAYEETSGGDPYELWFMSRPDALLLERATRQLYILSFKTAASWDIRKERDAQHDMQGLSEGVEVERRLGEWWDVLHSLDQEKHEVRRGVPDQFRHIAKADATDSLIAYLRSLPAPPRIHAIRYEYMLKGSRRHDKDLSARLGLDCHTQSSPLVRAYYSAGMAQGDEAWNWSYDYLKDTGETGRLYWKAWRPAFVWEHMPVREWIDRLDDTHETVGEEGQARGWSGRAQATGFTTEHPLDSVFLPPVVIYRNEDDLRDWMDQTEHQERTVAEGVAAVRACGDEGERRHALNIHFPMYRNSCEYPSTCAFVRLCYGGEDIRRDPLGSGQFVVRTPNHPVELEYRKEVAK